jgi:MtrB/PioB family decaheme-associated outer membrane protein
MKTFSSLLVLAALGALPASVFAAPDVDLSKWKCESCPFEKAAGGSVDAGLGVQRGLSSKSVDLTGLQREGGFLVFDGVGRWRADDGYYADVEANDLGLDIRSLAATVGWEGGVKFQAAYSELPKGLSDEASTPFIGFGTGLQSLPFPPAPTTAAMALAGNLQPVDLGFKRKRLDAAASGTMISPEWSWRVDARSETKDGTQLLAGSFSSNASQLVAPVDTTSDQFGASAAYATRTLHGSVGYRYSRFTNHDPSLTWANPFTAGAGATTGQMAQAPDNHFHEIVANGGWEITPTVIASGDVSFGRMTQDDPFLAATLNPTLVVGPLPATSLQGKVDTFDASARITATPMEGVRVHAAYIHDARDNRTASNAYPAVTTDISVGTTPRTNQAFDFKQDRFKLGADWRGANRMAASAGIDTDYRMRTQQDVQKTRETTLWGRLVAPLHDAAEFTLKLAHGDRQNSGYGVATWVDPPENPLMRKFNLADRRRDVVNLRVDLRPSETVTVGLVGDYAADNYYNSPLGLTDGRSSDLGIDVGWALSDTTQLRAFGQAQQISSRQTGSQAYAQPDWIGNNKDQASVVGFGLRQLMMDNKLQLDGDVVFARSRSDTSVDVATLNSAFPVVKYSQDTLRLSATYQLRDDLAVVGRWWYERYHAQDWHIDGVAPATVPNLLALGEQAPHHHVNVLSLALRYRF